MQIEYVLAYPQKFADKFDLLYGKNATEAVKLAKECIKETKSHE